MSETQTLVLDGESMRIAAHHCFACGTLNEHGLKLDLHLGAGRAWTDLRLDSRFEGWEGVAHGGIVSTILDEVMAWSLVASDAWGVTARMTTVFHAPVAIGMPIHAEGALSEGRRRVFRTTGTIVAPDGRVLASAEGTYVAARDDEKRRLQARYGFRAVASPNRPINTDIVDPRPAREPAGRSDGAVAVEHR
ncbi:MAG TPA: PaaI family thioesterase [Candidatus Limnocylindrales bacterium]|nr:PaaI family thioesterase [Candidatus Limnocylindrales bacterium]